MVLYRHRLRQDEVPEFELYGVADQQDESRAGYVKWNREHVSDTSSAQLKDLASSSIVQLGDSHSWPLSAMMVDSNLRCFSLAWLGLPFAIEF